MSIYRPASNKAFGFLLAGVCALLSVFYFFSVEAKVTKYALLFASLALILISLKAPHLLAPLNRVWMKLGQKMGLIISPLILGIIFFLLITPFSIVARLCGRDELILKKPDTQSFWRDRVELSSGRDSFKDQF
jgi:hypothetical protein